MTVLSLNQVKAYKIHISPIYTRTRYITQQDLTTKAPITYILYIMYQIHLIHPSQEYSIYKDGSKQVCSPFQQFYNITKGVTMDHFFLSEFKLKESCWLKVYRIIWMIKKNSRQNCFGASLFPPLVKAKNQLQILENT